MVAYRFCRPDDLPRLVEAVNLCVRPHLPGAPEETAETFRRAMKELDVWPSNSMIAAAADAPVAVLVGTKRADEVLVHRLGTRPGFERQGHASHLVTSLSQKLAVLGPERLVAEVPTAAAAVAAVLTRLGWRREAALRDWRWEGAARAVDLAAVSAVTYAELREAGLLALPPDAAWERAAPSLAAQPLEGLAVRRAGRLAAWVLFRPPQGEAPEVRLAVLGSEPGSAGALAGLVAALAATSGLPPLLPREPADGLAPEALRELGFVPGAEYHRWATTAQPL